MDFLQDISYSIAAQHKGRMMQIFTIKLVGLKKNKNKHLVDCMDEFEYFSGSKKSIIKTEKKNAPKPKQKMLSLSFSISKIIERRLLKGSKKSGEIPDQILKKENPAKENIYISVCEQTGGNKEENIYEDPSDTLVSLSPDYELFDGDFQFMYYNDAFFC